MGAVRPPKPPGQRRNRSDAGDRTLPVTGRKGRPPSCPVPLGAAGAALWRVLWATPQASTWSNADKRGVALRCELEDVWHAHCASGEPDMKVYNAIIGWEDRWGFNPKARAMLHMWIEGDVEPAKPAAPTQVTDIRERLKGLA